MSSTPRKTPDRLNALARAGRENRVRVGTMRDLRAVAVLIDELMRGEQKSPGELDRLAELLDAAAQGVREAAGDQRTAHRRS